MRVLWFSWRDIKNPEAGGAEVFTYEVTRRLINRGHKITLFTARYPNATDHDIIDGIDVIRDGGKYTVYARAKAYYDKNKPSFDIVVDEMNTRPFLTPKFVREIPIVGLIHNVPQRGLLYELPFPVNYITYHYLVKKWFRNYRDIPTITVSNSQMELLKELGFGRIFVVPEGLSVTPLDKVPAKESVPTLAFIGRLKGYKLPDHAIRAFSLIKREVPDAKMLIIGDGYMREKLERMNISDVFFCGRVDNKTKYELLKKVHLVLVPSIEEGWGLVVTEANAMGTPTVAYNVAGLRDSVQHDHTGILVDSNSPEALAKAALTLLNDKERLDKFGHNALKFARKFSWDNTAQAFEDVIKTVA